MRPLATLLAACLLAGCSLFVSPPPSSVPVPAADQTPQVGVYYRSVTTCLLPILIGNAYWTFDAFEGWNPPPLPRDENISPYPIPGVIRLTSPTTAVFRADTNGQERPMTRAGSRNPMEGYGCL